MTNTSTLTVQGIDVHIAGSGPQTVLMLHGWPDTHHLWDASVMALQDHYRCVRLTLPGFAPDLGARPTALTEMVSFLDAVVEAVSPDQAITLLLHDWGCIFGYEFAARYPARVKRIVAVDVGDHNSGAFLKSLSTSAKFQVLAYQFWLAMAWQLGDWGLRALGDRMTRWMARALRCPTDPAAVGWTMNYPYAMQWFGLKGGLKSAAQVRPKVPMLFCYGERKPFMFHSPKWQQAVAGRPGSAVQGFACGHWVMVSQQQAFNQRVRDWLASTPG